MTVPQLSRYDQKAHRARAAAATQRAGKSVWKSCQEKEPQFDGTMKNSLLPAATANQLQPQPRAAIGRCRGGGSSTARIAAAAVALAAVGIFAQLAGEVRNLRTLYEDARDQIDRLRSEVNAYKFDSLTGLATRRDFGKLLKTLWSRWARRGQPFTFAMVDLDNLHAINRRFGFQSGDAFIRSVAIELQRSCGGGGGAAAGSTGGGNGTNVFRVGGDEFAVLAPGDEVAALSLRLDAVRGVQYYVVASSDAAAASLRGSSEFFDLVDRGLIARKKGRRDTWWPETPTPSARPVAANAWQSAAAAASSASQAKKKKN